MYLLTLNFDFVYIFILGLELISESDVIKFQEGRPRSYSSYINYLNTYLQGNSFLPLQKYILSVWSLKQFPIQ